MSDLERRRDRGLRRWCSTCSTSAGLVEVERGVEDVGAGAVSAAIRGTWAKSSAGAAGDAGALGAASKTSAAAVMS